MSLFVYVSRQSIQLGSGHKYLPAFFGLGFSICSVFKVLFAVLFVSVPRTYQPVARLRPGQVYLIYQLSKPSVCCLGSDTFMYSLEMIPGVHIQLH